MIDTRLLNLVPQSKKMIFKVVLNQWLSLLCNLVFLLTLGSVIVGDFSFILISIQVVAVALKIYFVSKMKYHATQLSNLSKYEIRHKLLNKLFGFSYQELRKYPVSYLTQIIGEGVDQLEVYFGGYIPQFIYAMVAPMTLFVVLSFHNFVIALVLMAMVPMIPISIILVQKIAKKILSKYWNQYTALGSSFLDNVQGLTTLKIYGADETMHQKMNVESESFRKATMKVLIMQLNSISVMDLVVYLGSAIAIFMSVQAYLKGTMALGSVLLFILAASEFFIPLRRLGSYFHVATNGAAAADLMFEFLDAPQLENTETSIPNDYDITIRNLSYSYDKKEVLHAISQVIPEQSFIGIVGRSGCGKSTLLKLLAHQLHSESIRMGDVAFEDISNLFFNRNVILVSDQSHIFKGTLRFNLEMAGNFDDALMLGVLIKLKLDHYGLDYEVKERGSNLSGGEKQRLVFARALLFDAKIYLLDEITSNVDTESEKIMMDVISNLKHKTIVMVSHRLYNVKNADEIWAMDEGKIVGTGKHQHLLETCPQYVALYETQAALEAYDD